MYKQCAAAIVGAMLSATAVQAQQQVEWKQTLNTPKGLNLPSGVTGDILGIVLGDSYAEVKVKLNKLLAESVTPPKSGDPNINALMGESSNGPLTETNMALRLQVPGGTIDAAYVGQVLLIRKVPGSTQQSVHDSLDIKLSAPSSGHQVLGIKRAIMYPVPADQARVSEVLAAVKAKFKAEAQRVDEFTYRFMWDNGRSYVPPRLDAFNGCRPQYAMQGQFGDVGAIINRNGDCDVVLEVSFQYGISKDHAQSVTFILSDNERTKLNLTADFAFLNGYVRDLQTRTKGSAPKL